MTDDSTAYREDHLDDPRLYPLYPHDLHATAESASWLKALVVWLAIFIVLFTGVFVMASWAGWGQQ